MRPRSQSNACLCGFVNWYHKFLWVYSLPFFNTSEGVWHTWMAPVSTAHTCQPWARGLKSKLRGILGGLFSEHSFWHVSLTGGFIETSNSPARLAGRMWPESYLTLASFIADIALSSIVSGSANLVIRQFGLVLDTMNVMSVRSQECWSLSLGCVVPRLCLVLLVCTPFTPH